MYYYYEAAVTHNEINKSIAKTSLFVSIGVGDGGRVALASSPRLKKY